ncbi:MAG: NAD-dependent epimerase/dehydratase family protein [Nitrospirales bacterium]
MNKNSKIFVAGSHPVLRSALIRVLEQEGYYHRVGENGEVSNLKNQQEVFEFFKVTNPEYVFYVGGKAGGIRANQQYPADLMTGNILSQTNIIQAASQSRVKKLLYLGSSCSYPKICPQPMRIESLMTGSLEPTSEAYATAKLAGIVMVKAYRTQFQLNGIVGIPGDVFGPDDDFALDTAHVLPALMRKIHEAKCTHADSVEIWGSGDPQRQFMHADDVARACVFVMRSYESSKPINLGSGPTMSIKALAFLIAEVVGYQGSFHFNTHISDGAPLKSLDCSPLISMGWLSSMNMREALEDTYQWFCDHESCSKEIKDKAKLVRTS